MVDLHVEAGEKQAAAHRVAAGSPGAARGPDGRVIRDDRVVDLDVAARRVDTASLDRRVAGDRAVVDLQVAVDHGDAAPWTAWPPEMVLSWTSTLPPMTWMPPTIDMSLMTRLPPVSLMATPELSTIVRPLAPDPSKLKLPLKLSGDERWIVSPARPGRRRSCRRSWRGRLPGAANPARCAWPFVTVRVLSSVRPSSSDATGRKMVRAATPAGRPATGELSRIGSGTMSSLYSSCERFNEEKDEKRRAITAARGAQPERSSRGCSVPGAPRSPRTFCLARFAPLGTDDISRPGLGNGR